MPLPTTQVWTDGEDPDNIPTADDLNLDWRDSFDFLLGYSRPFIYVKSTVAQVLTAGVFQAINWDSEQVKRGGMVHTGSSSIITVPYTGQYVGFCQISTGVLSAAAYGTRVVGLAMINGVQACRWDSGNPTTVGFEMSGTLTLDCQANDQITVQVRNQTGTASTANNVSTLCRIALWYAGSFV